VHDGTAGKYSTHVSNYANANLTAGDGLRRSAYGNNNANANANVGDGVRCAKRKRRIIIASFMLPDSCNSLSDFDGTDTQPEPPQTHDDLFGFDGGRGGHNGGGGGSIGGKHGLYGKGAGNGASIAAAAAAAHSADGGGVGGEEEGAKFEYAMTGLTDADASIRLCWVGRLANDGYAPYTTHQGRVNARNRLVNRDVHPVFMSSEASDLFLSYCNTVLWPLLHYQPITIEKLQEANDQFAIYEAANRRFADVILALYRDGDVIWVHDYHLCLLPAMLRSAKKTIKVGFFLHTPFPTADTFKVLPWREELLNGMLSAHLIGFHAHDYARYFSNACASILRVRCTAEGVDIGGGLCALGVFPLGISPRPFRRIMQTHTFREKVSRLRAEFGDKKVICNIDRLNPEQGILHKLCAFERFLELYPAWRDKVVLVQVAVPSRRHRVDYAGLLRKVHTLVGRINGRFGSLMGVPIHFLDQAAPFELRCALHYIADVSMCTPLRAGMSRVPFEFIKCQGPVKRIAAWLAQRDAQRGTDAATAAAAATTADFATDAAAAAAGTAVNIIGSSVSESDATATAVQTTLEQVAATKASKPPLKVRNGDDADLYTRHRFDDDDGLADDVDETEIPTDIHVPGTCTHTRFL
jgi:trehalose-6-phosphate synthase